MSKPINEPRMVQQALVSDEDLSFELAALVPTANGITNAASTFIDKATKLLLSDKIILTNEQHTAVATAIAIAQLTVKEGAAISKLLRNPDASAEVIAGLRLTSEDRQDAWPASLDAALQDMRAARQAHRTGRGGHLLQPAHEPDQASDGVVSHLRPNHRERHIK